MLVLGLDPGSRCTGVGLVAEESGVLRLVLARALYLPQGKELDEKLGFLFEELIKIIDTYQPGEAAIEDVFFAANARSALRLGQARGAAITACAWKNLKVFSYEPTRVKNSIVGVGRASKEQVAFMVKQMLNSKASWPLDVSDALAVAITHLNARRLNTFLEKT
ncbi:MAG: crossover junction endodeoxyribonuclease RuvC [Desulfonauticus sp.]|jgi:crossover junction endodeoxyribonuclease RuvC|nr:crossover junction endodeoxyribonuclease RuvC [Desulfonauticus sp.]